MTWQDAQSYCRARFTDLATADTMSDVSLLVNAVDSGYSGSVWIGLHIGTEYRWIWSMGTRSQFSMWGPGQPYGDGECVKSFNGRWYDESCSTALPFVCFNGESSNLVHSLSHFSWSWAKGWSWSCVSEQTALVLSSLRPLCHGEMLRVTADNTTLTWRASAEHRSRIWSVIKHRSGSVCSWIRGNGLTNGASSLETGQKVNRPRFQDLVTVLACQQPILGNGLVKAVI